MNNWKSQLEEYPNISNDFWHRFMDSLKYDNTMPFCKTEVVYDTLLSEEVLKQLLDVNGIEADFVTKEFPVPINATLESEKDKSGYFSIDYIMCSKYKETIYIVELKTTEKSFDELQLHRYLELCQKNNFISILKDYVNKKYAGTSDYNNQRQCVTDKLCIKSDTKNIEIIQSITNVELIYIKPESTTLQEILNTKGKRSEKHGGGKNNKYRIVRDELTNHTVKVHEISLNSIETKIAYKNNAKDYQLLSEFNKIWNLTKSTKN